MSNVIFVRTRHHYDSYQDFWLLVELAGYPIIFTDQVDISRSAVFILTPHNGEWKSVIDSQRGKPKHSRLINWNLERPGGSGGLDNYMYDNHKLVQDGYFDEIWVSDIELARRCKFSYVMLGGHKYFNSAAHIAYPKQYDIIHLSYGSPRRSFLFDAPGVCKTQIAGITIAPNAWGEQRHLNLLGSKYMFNIHQDEHMYIEPLRFVLAAMYKLPILTEFCYNPYPYNVIDLGFNTNIFGNVKQHLMRYELHKSKGYDAYHMMTEEYNFRHCVEVVL